MNQRSMMQIEWQAHMGKSLLAINLFDTLFAAYDKTTRHYHGIHHIAAMLDALKAANQLTKANYLAAWFHDAVYKPGMPDNEEKSADWARDALAKVGINTPIIDTIYARIIATKEHKTLGNIEGDSFLDADMAILGTSTDTYVRYTANVRKEFAFVPDELFAKGRSDFIRITLNMQRIFHTEYFHDRYETQARTNLQRELQALS
jgi:predicted metal-dependent HD superfamily phosphohydrolase